MERWLEAMPMVLESSGARWPNPLLLFEEGTKFRGQDEIPMQRRGPERRSDEIEKKESTGGPLPTLFSAKTIALALRGSDSLRRETRASGDKR